MRERLARRNFTSDNYELLNNDAQCIKYRMEESHESLMLDESREVFLEVFVDMQLISFIEFKFPIRQLTNLTLNCFTNNEASSTFVQQIASDSSIFSVSHDILFILHA